MPRPFGSTVESVAEMRDLLEGLVRARSTPQALAFRCRIVLPASKADAPSNQDIAAELDCDRHTVGQCRERFVVNGLPALQDAPRSGRAPEIPPLRPPLGHHPGQ